MKKVLLVCMFLGMLISGNTQVSKLKVSQVGKTISFSFNFSSEAAKLDDEYAVLIEYSLDGGRTYLDKAKSLEGTFGNDQAGNPIVSGYTVNLIDWHVLEDVSSFTGDNIVFKLTVFETDVVYTSKGSISQLIVPTFLREDQSYKVTNWMYGAAVLSGIAYLSKNNYYNQYLNAAPGTDLKDLYNRANLSNKLMYTSAGVTGALFTINLVRLTSGKGRYSELRKRAIK